MSLDLDSKKKKKEKKTREKNLEIRFDELACSTVNSSRLPGNYYLRRHAVHKQNELNNSSQWAEASIRTVITTRRQLASL